jgi:quercetin dioxygenase-like cupin family protein
VSQVVDLAGERAIELVPGVTMKPLFGAGAMLNLIEFEPNALVPAHSHPHEQLGLVLDGDLVMTIGREEHRMRPGHAYQIPGDVEHDARAGESGCRVLDVFQPVREDYLERARSA